MRLGQWGLVLRWVSPLQWPVCGPGASTHHLRCHWLLNSFLLTANMANTSSTTILLITVRQFEIYIRIGNFKDIPSPYLLFWVEVENNLTNFVWVDRWQSLDISRNINLDFPIFCTVLSFRRNRKLGVKSCLHRIDMEYWVQFWLFPKYDRKFCVRLAGSSLVQSGQWGKEDWSCQRIRLGSEHGPHIIVSCSMTVLLSVCTSWISDCYHCQTAKHYYLRMGLHSGHRVHCTNNNDN